MSVFLVPAGTGESEYTEKRSRFLGHVSPAGSEEEARAFIADVKKTHYDARHNCWCYIIRGGPERYGDDGEPQGTAGLPMLEVFRREGVENAVCVVTRYFGGVLLGAGGLLRAYTKSAKAALDDAGIAEIRPWVTAELSCSYAMAEPLKTELCSRGCIIEDTDYGAQVTVRLLIPKELTDAVSARVFDMSRGAVTVAVTGETGRAVPLSK